MDKIQHVDRLTQRLADAEAEAIALGESLAKAEAEWGNALATGDAKAEKMATATLDGARQARDGALSKLPLMRQALHTARREALPERCEAASQELEPIVAEALEVAEKLLAAHDAFLLHAAELSKLEGDHRAVMVELRQHVAEAGAPGLELPEEMHFPAVPGCAMAGRQALQPLRISARTIYRNHKGGTAA